MTPRTLTIAVILVAVGGLIGYDVWAYVHGGAEATISRAVSETGMGVHLIISNAFAFLMGHLFWPQPEPPQLQPMEPKR